MQKRIISTALSAMKTMRSMSLKKQYSILILMSLSAPRRKFRPKVSKLFFLDKSPLARAIPINLETVFRAEEVGSAKV